MSSGSSNSSILNMPDYGQGLAEALQAQSDALSGKLTGTPLQEIVERYERPLRMSAAQIDNDVLRQTLLGDRVPITAGQPQPTTPTTPTDPLQPTPQEPAPTTQVDYGGTIEESSGRVITGDTQIDPRWAKLRADLADAGGDLSKMSDALYDNREVLREVDVAESKGYFNSARVRADSYNRGDIDSVMKGLLSDLALTGKTSAVDKILDNYGNPEPIYRKNEDGTDFVLPKDASGNFILESQENLRRSGDTTTQIDYGGTVDESTGKVIVGQGELPAPIRELQEIRARHGSNPAELSNSVDQWMARNKDFDISDPSQYNTDGGVFQSDLPSVQQLGTEIIRDIIQTGTSDSLNQYLDNVGTSEPIYKKNPDGTDFVVPKGEDGNFILEANDQSEVPDGGTLPNTPIEPATPTEPTTPTQPVDAENITGYKRAGTGLIDMLGDRRMAIDPTTGLSTNRESGFDDQGNFLGLAALAEDIQRGNLSRQRESDLSDVERLSGRYNDVMDIFRPGTQQALTDASAVLSDQKDNLTGAGAITAPEDSTYGGDITASTMNAATVADPLKLSANTQFGGDLGLSKTSTGEDSLRSILLGDARTALGQGLTEREQANIANSARARSTMMGRTFDQSGAIAEAEARVQEDNARRFQNRSFLQSVMGQEAGYQQGDITRGMAQESEQAGLQQQVNLAQAQMDQQANAFDADASLRAATVNQGQQQQANQFGVGATMDAQRLNEQLKQQGTLGYIDAATRLAALEDQYALDPFQAILGRAGGGSLQAGQGVFGQAGYGLQSGPQYLNPESGLGYISSMAANEANMYAANQSANASRNSGMMNGLGSLGGGIIGGLIGLAG